MALSMKTLRTPMLRKTELSITTLSIMAKAIIRLNFAISNITLSITKLNMMALSITILGKMSLGIMKLGKKAFSIMIQTRNNTQHNNKKCDTKHNIYL